MCDPAPNLVCILSRGRFIFKMLVESSLLDISELVGVCNSDDVLCCLSDNTTHVFKAEGSSFLCPPRFLTPSDLTTPCSISVLPRGGRQ